MSKSRYWRSSITQAHDSLLRDTLKGEKYIKLYSFHYLINGFAVFVSSQQVIFAHNISLYYVCYLYVKSSFIFFYLLLKRLRSFQGEGK